MVVPKAPSQWQAYAGAVLRAGLRRSSARCLRVAAPFSPSSHLPLQQPLMPLQQPLEATSLQCHSWPQQGTPGQHHPVHSDHLGQMTLAGSGTPLAQVTASIQGHPGPDAISAVPTYKLLELVELRDIRRRPCFHKLVSHPRKQVLDLPHGNTQDAVAMARYGYGPPPSMLLHLEPNHGVWIRATTAAAPSATSY
ncbi:hypothetical protein EMCRGX_G005692 [Ephydatia muelleri]